MVREEYQRPFIEKSFSSFSPKFPPVSICFWTANMNLRPSGEPPKAETNASFFNFETSKRTTDTDLPASDSGKANRLIEMNRGSKRVVITFFIIFGERRVLANVTVE